MKTGLVLEGGAMRGLFTAGVIDVMMERGITFDGLVGVSAGSSFGCNYKSRQPGRVLRYNLRYGRDPRYMGLRSLLTTGNLVGAEFAYHTLPLELDIFDIDAFERNPMEFHLVCTDVVTGAPVYYKMDRVDRDSLEWLRASASMPVLTRPVRVDDGRRMLDGGISDSIPLAYFQHCGFTHNVVVLTQPRDFRKKPAPRWLFRLLMPYAPAIAEAMGRRHIMYNAQLDYLTAQEALGRTLVIAPDTPLPIGRTDTDPAKMTEVYHIGRAAGERHIEAVRAFLQAASVRRTTPADLPDVMSIYAHARARMSAGGNPAQWVGGYPSQQVISSDIEAGSSYVVESGGKIAGVFTFAIGHEPTYAVIDGSWPDSAPYGTIHRIAAAPGAKGIADTALAFCRRAGVNIRIDTHAANAPMLRWITTRGFTPCGTIHVADGTPRLAFHLANA